MSLSMQGSVKWRPGDLAPPCRILPSRKMTALSYSCTIWTRVTASQGQGGRKTEEVEIDGGKTTLKQTQSEKGSVTRTRSQEAAISSQPHTPGPALAPAPELVTEGAGLGGSGGWGCGQGAGQPGSSFSAMVP